MAHAFFMEEDAVPKEINMPTSPITTGWITLNTRCNNRCSWCYQLDEITHNPSVMSQAMAERLVDFYSELDVLSCIFIGGEPTLYRGLPKLIDQAKARGIEEATVVTNGRRLSRMQYTQMLKDAGTDLFSITIHSHKPETHNRIAGADSWQQTFTGICNVLEIGGKCVINLVVGRGNLNEVGTTISWLLGLGVDGITLSSAVGAVEESGLNDSHSIDPREYTKLVVQLRDTPDSVAFLHELPLCLYSRDEFVDLISRGKLGYGCHIGIGNGLSVNPHGETIPCNSMYNLPMVRLFSDEQLIYTVEEFLELWENSRELLDLRAMANVYRSEICCSCNLWNMCNSGCPLTWANLDPDDYINSGLVDVDLSTMVLPPKRKE